MQRCLAAMLCFAHLWMTGCAAIFFDPMENVTFQSEPDGAQIKLDGRPVGRTPQMLNVEAKDHGVQFERDNCEPYMTRLNASTSGGAVATSVVFGIVIGGIFELLSLVEGTGIYRDLPDNVYANLDCAE